MAGHRAFDHQKVVFGDYFNNLEVLHSHTFVAHLAGHTHSFEYLCGIGAGTDRAGRAQTVVLTVGSLTYATETMALNYTLEAFTLRGADDVDEVLFGKEIHCDGIAEGVLFVKPVELGQVALGCNTCSFEVSKLGLCAVLFLLLLETELESGIAVLLNCFDLCYHARTYFDNSARHIFAVGTENGCHSDFFSN